MKNSSVIEERRLRSFVISSAAVVLLALSVTGCSQSPGVEANEKNVIEDSTRGTSTPSTDSTGETSTSTQSSDDASKVALMKFIATVDYIIGAARQTAEERGSKILTVADLQSGVKDYGITEEPDIWSVVETSNGFGVGAPVFGLGVCGVTVDPNWKDRPGAEILLTRTECTGVKTAAPSAPPAPRK
jgi:hypothetical protein